MNTEVGLWRNKTTGEIYEIKRISLKTKELQMCFKSGNISKPKDPFALAENWNRYDTFEKIE